MKVSLYQQTMKVWVVLAVAVLCACSISSSTAMDDEHKLAVDKVIFKTRTATRLNYMYFMSELRTALLENGDTSGNLALLPPQSLQPTDPRRYLLVELSNGEQTVTLALDVTNVYILGYRPSTGTGSYFFNDVSQAVRNALFPNTQRESLPFPGNYVLLERAAGVADRGQIPLGISELAQHIYNMNYQTATSHRASIARALLVCIQMVSEAARFRNIEQQIVEVAQPRADGTYGVLNPDGLMMEFQTSWGQISAAVQSATNEIFRRAVRLAYSGGQELVFDTVASVRFIVAIMPVICQNRGANLQFLRMPASISSSRFSSSLPMVMRSTGLEDNDEKCERALEPTSRITGRDGLCVDVYQGSYQDGNSIVLSKCAQNQASQLWTLRSDNTIRSGGKCLTTYGYAQGNYVMIYDCNTAVPEATKWEMQSDGSIRNPRSGLFLIASIYNTGGTNLVVGKNIHASKQAFYASNNTTPSVTKLVGYNGMCLHARDIVVALTSCVSNDADQQWAIYPDGTIRPQKNRQRCLKYGNAGRNRVNVDPCNGMSDERWQFLNDGTIFHANTQLVMNAIVYSGTTVLEVTVSPYINGALHQIWFKV